MSRVETDLQGHRARTARALAAGRKPRRWGAWYVAEHRFRVMKSYTGTVVVAGIGNPLLYLYALGVGLATIVDGNVGADAVDGVSYLVFVAPALLASAAITVASEEFTYPDHARLQVESDLLGHERRRRSRPTQIVDGVIISVAVRMLVNARAVLRAHARVRRGALGRRASSRSRRACSPGSRSAPC